MRRMRRIQGTGSIGRLFGVAAVVALAAGAFDLAGIDSGATAYAQIVKIPNCTPVMPPPLAKKKPRRIPNITEANYRRLSEAQEFVDEDQYAQAVELLTAMAGRSRRYNGAELAQVYNMLAYASYEMDNLEDTIRYYELVLAQMPNISEGTETTTLNQLSKLYFQEGMKFEGAQARPWLDKALAKMEEWMTKADNPGPDAHFYIAQIYYQMEDFDAAIERLEEVVRISRERCQQVRENWWTMLQFLYFEKENWPKVIEILEILVKEFPKRAYWVNLASVYGETDQPQKQLWTMEAAHVGGFLDKEMDVRTFGGLLLQNEVPNRATKYLQRGFDEEIVERNVVNLQTLGQAYQLAQDVDKAIPVFEEAGDLAEDGETYDRLAVLYLQKDQFSKCQTAAESALDKGGLKNQLATKITLASCQFNLDRLAAARRTFVDVRREARQQRERSEERMANQWITYIDSESRRRAEIERAGG